MADLLAQLTGYEAELARYENANRSERADQVRSEIDRVQAEVRSEVNKLQARAEGHEDAGQDVLAAQCRVEAKRLARALPAEEPKTARGRRGGKETAADSTPKERA